MVEMVAQNRCGCGRCGCWFAIRTITSKKAGVKKLLESLTTLSQIPAVPGPEVLKDFDTIAALGSTPPADEELLKVMQ